MQRTGVAVAEDDGKGERCRPARSFETPPRSTHPPTAPQDEREGGEVYVGPDASTGSAGTRGGAARTRGGLAGGYNADIAAWGEALPDSKSPIGRGSPSIEEWTRFMGASPLRRFALARLCLTSNL